MNPERDTIAMTNRYTKRHSKISGDLKSAPDAIPYITNLREWANNRVRDYERNRPTMPSITTYKVPGSGSNIYTVTVRGFFAESCSCPGFQFRRKCKHVLNWTPGRSAEKTSIKELIEPMRKLF